MHNIFLMMITYYTIYGATTWNRTMIRTLPKSYNYHYTMAAKSGAPNGIRTHVARLRILHPYQLDDRSRIWYPRQVTLLRLSVISRMRFFCATRANLVAGSGNAPDSLVYETSMTLVHLPAIVWYPMKVMLPRISRVRTAFYF